LEKIEIVSKIAIFNFLEVSVLVLELRVRSRELDLHSGALYSFVSLICDNSGLNGIIFETFGKAFKLDLFFINLKYFFNATERIQYGK
jgi:hypothetical protein